MRTDGCRQHTLFTLNTLNTLNNSTHFTLSLEQWRRLFVRIRHEASSTVALILRKKKRHQLASPVTAALFTLFYFSSPSLSLSLSLDGSRHLTQPPLTQPITCTINDLFIYFSPPAHRAQLHPSPSSFHYDRDAHTHLSPSNALTN